MLLISSNKAQLGHLRLKIIITLATGTGINIAEFKLDYY